MLCPIKAAPAAHVLAAKNPRSVSTLSTSSFSSSYWRYSSLSQCLTEAGKAGLWKREGHYLALVEGDL